MFSAILCMTFGAFCVWLLVRIVNRRERWAKRLGAAVVALLLAYPVSIGPAFVLACCISARPGPDWKWPITAFHWAYAPVMEAAVVTNSTEFVVAYIDWCTRKMIPPSH